MITFGDDGAYGHPDHVTIGAAVTMTDEVAVSNPRGFALLGSGCQTVLRTANRRSRLGAGDRAYARDRIRGARHGHIL